MNSADTVEDITTTPPSGETEIAPDEGEPGEESPSKKSAEARIDELVAEIKETKRQLNEVIKAPPPPDIPVEPDVQKAVEYLRSLGVVTREDLQNSFRTMEDKQILSAEHQRLSTAYDGQDGRPKYNQQAIEDYMRNYGVYNPEVAYKVLHEAELTDWALKKAEEGKKQRPYVEKGGTPGGTRNENTITREMITEWMKTPEGRLKYEQNRDKILKLMAQGQL